MVNVCYKQHLNVLIEAAILLEQQTYSFDSRKISLLYIAYKLTTKKKNVFRKGFMIIISKTNGVKSRSRHVRAVAKISSFWVNTTSRQGIKQLEISFGSIFL